MSAFSVGTVGKRCRPAPSDDHDTPMYEHNTKKRPGVILPRCRREYVSKKPKSRTESIFQDPKLNHIGLMFRRDMPYGCQYDERTRTVSYFNYDFCYLGTTERYNFEKMKNAETLELYTASTIPITNSIHMLNYLNQLFQFIHYICADSLFNGSKYYNDARDYYQVILFGSFHSRQAIDWRND